MKSGVKILYDAQPLFMKGLRRLEGLKDDDGLTVAITIKDQRSDGKIGNQQLAMIQELGSPAQNIPARPFIGPGIRRVAPVLGLIMKEAANHALFARSGRSRSIAALNEAGRVMVDSIKRQMVEGAYPPLSPKTVAARRSRGQTSIQPLVDTGELQASIDYQIRKV